MTRTVSDTVRVILSGTAGERVQLRARTLTGGLDLRVRTFGPFGELFSDRFCDGLSSLPCTLTVALTLPESGFWSFEVSDNGSDESGDYLLQLERMPNAPGDGVPSVPWNVEISDSICCPTDFDFLKIEAIEPAVLELALRSLTAGLDLQADILDAEGNPYGWGPSQTHSCSGGSGAGAIRCSFTIRLGSHGRG